MLHVFPDGVLAPPQELIAGNGGRGTLYIIQPVGMFYTMQ
jgi:hypothetical protein